MFLCKKFFILIELFGQPDCNIFVRKDKFIFGVVELRVEFVFSFWISRKTHLQVGKLPFESVQVRLFLGRLLLDLFLLTFDFLGLGSYVSSLSRRLPVWFNQVCFEASLNTYWHTALD